MKKNTPNPLETPGLPDAEILDRPQPAKTTRHTTSIRLRNPRQLAPVSQIFTVRPDIDTPTLLVHASETLASLNVMTTDLAAQLEGPHRDVALAIRQLTQLTEMLINQALDNLGSSEPAIAPVYH